MKLLLLLLLSAFCAPTLCAGEVEFHRAINLNGPALMVDGHHWEAHSTTNFTFKGNLFENQSVPLRPPAEARKAQMLRSSIWGNKVELEVTGFTEGAYQVFLYVWEDNQTERFDLRLNGQIVAEAFNSGSRGSWRRLGPWRISPVDGKIKLSGSGGAANLSGIEFWRGDAPVPAAPEPQFAAAVSPEQGDFFEKRIRPLLVENCYECHSAGAKKIGGGLLLDSRAGVIRGGDNGPVITPGHPEASLLVQAVKYVDPELTMPPKTRLSLEKINDLEHWIRWGAPDPRTDSTALPAAKPAIDFAKAREFWSFRPVMHPVLPAVKQRDWPLNEIDFFVLQRMEHAQLEPANGASKRALIRRATYDLTGLPPSPGDIDSFLRDDSDDAFAKVVDRLLGSKDYGERWGRHWLDVVRYADTAGDNSDFPVPQLYRYRNWVIDAFNRDLPYDQFVHFQLAGDLLPGRDVAETQERLVATGYIANARRFGSRVSDYPQHLTIEDTIDNLGRTYLGLTINCARCHNHKFDPISNEDYYALYGIFHSTRYPWPGIELEQKQRDLVPLVPEEVAAVARKAHQEKEKELASVVTDLEKQVKSAEEGDNRKGLEKKLADAKSAADKHRRTALPFPQAYAIQEAAKIEDVPLQQKGDPAKPGEIVRRGFLKVLNGGEVPAREMASGRLQLADWITSKENPLTARVMVNRIWLYHFGKGLVATPNDFGKQGKPPTHPELLDWLAANFMEHDWSIKKMHRLVMLSRTYQMASGLGPDALERDPANEMLSAFPRRRLDAESIRDTLLSLGGTLDSTPGLAHPFPPQTDWSFTQHNPFKAVYDTPRRSVYLMTQRIQRHPFLAIFDGADPSTSTGFRLATTTPVQALYLLNDPFVHEQGRNFAARLVSASGTDRGRWERAMNLALGRLPDSEETDSALQLLSAIRAKLTETNTPESQIETEAWQAMTRGLFRMNEFVYID